MIWQYVFSSTRYEYITMQQQVKETNVDTQIVGVETISAYH